MNFSSIYIHIAKYFESSLLDYKKADKIYRVGLKQITIESELNKIKNAYQMFSDRMDYKYRKDI